MYSFKGNVRYSETDPYGRLSLEALIDYFQDCSTFHSESLGLGISYLEANHLVWVLSAWQIVIDHMPKLCDAIEIGTFPYAFKGCFGYRNFWMSDGDNTYFARANSLWTLLDTKQMKPSKPTEKMLQGYCMQEKLAMEYAPRKIDLHGEGQYQEEIIVRSHHIDSNQHVNNGQYVRIALDYLPGGFSIRQMRAEYKKQAVLGDRLTVFVYAQPQSRVVALCDGKKEPYAVVEFTGTVSES